MQTLIDASIRHRVGHFIYSSRDTCPQEESLHLKSKPAELHDAKTKLEAYVRDKVPEERWTIVRPGFFVSPDSLSSCSDLASLTLTRNASVMIRWTTLRDRLEG